MRDGDPAHIVLNLRADIALKIVIQLVRRAGKHEILPHDQPQFIADIKKPVVRVVTAAPDADGVMIRRHTLRKELPGRFRRDSPKQMILRDIVRAHGKDGDAIYLMGKALSPLILFNPHGHRPNPDAPLPDIDRLTVRI